MSYQTDVGTILLGMVAQRFETYHISWLAWSAITYNFSPLSGSARRQEIAHATSHVLLKTLVLSVLRIVFFIMHAKDAPLGEPPFGFLLDKFSDPVDFDEFQVLYFAHPVFHPIALI